MKLITAIINKADAESVGDALREKNYRFTKIATYGGFLRKKNMTLLIGAQDENVEEALEILRSHCHERKEPVPVVSDNPYMPYGQYCSDVTVGGATVFITDVARFERL